MIQRFIRSIFFTVAQQAIISNFVATPINRYRLSMCKRIAPDNVIGIVIFVLEIIKLFLSIWDGKTTKFGNPVLIGEFIFRSR
ncbi:hypothetical protein D3C71_1050730 [compost metagenome]